MSAWMLTDIHHQILVAGVLELSRGRFRWNDRTWADMPDSLKDPNGFESVSDRYQAQYKWYDEGRRVLDYETYKAVAQMLKDTNAKSYLAKYSDHYNDEERLSFFDPIDWEETPLSTLTMIDPARLWNGMRCWKYQACEFDGFERSSGFRFIDSALEMIESHILNIEGVWSFESIDDARRPADKGSKAVSLTAMALGGE